MNRKPPSDDKQSNPFEHIPHLAKESTEQIWLAGLGAFSKAQQQGSKAFNALVQDGVALQKQAQSMAQEQFQQASEQISQLASKMNARAAEPLDKLESLFEQRVAKAMQRLGLPTRQEMQALREQVDALTHEVERLREHGKE
ncbi:phasin family protein [Diaphorobacter ruginosibacter]|uniref:phasin family protein n=1 Tax=Diaphorobacter ruginosibacter TaxID=1715720 RepID=UPI00333E79FC